MRSKNYLLSLKRMSCNSIRLMPAMICIAIFTSDATSAPLAYDEAVDGDIAGTLLVLDEGTNTISGTVSATGTFDDPQNTNVEDGDSINLDLPAGLVLNRLSFVIGDLSFGPANGANGTILPRIEGFFGGGNSFQTIINPSNVPTGIADRIVSSGEQLEFTNDVPLPLAGDDFFILSVTTAELGAAYDSSFTYSWVLETAAVPEPSSAILSLAATLGLYLRRSR